MALERREITSRLNPRVAREAGHRGLEATGRRVEPIRDYAHEPPWGRSPRGLRDRGCLATLLPSNVIGAAEGD